MLTRRTRRVLLALLLLLLLAVAATLSSSRLLSREGIQIRTWQGFAINTNGLSLDALSLSLPAVQLELAQIHLPWRGLSLHLPVWQQVQIQELHVTLLTTAPTTTPSNWRLQQIAALLSKLPQQLQIQHLRLALPCAQGSCLLNGELTLERSANAEQVELLLRQPDEALSWHLLLHNRSNLLQAQLQLSQQQHPLLQAHTSISQRSTDLRWQGRLSAELTHSQTLQRFLSQWLPANQSLLNSPDAGQLQAHWQLSLPGQELALEPLKHASGSLHARAYLSQPWPLPGVGQVQGNLALVLHAEAGNWLADNLFADLKLNAIAPQLLAELPPTLQPQRLHLRLLPNPGASPQAQPNLALKLELEASAASSAQLQADLLLAKQAPWALHLDNAKLTGAIPASHSADWQLGASQMQLHFAASLTQQQLSLQLQQGSSLSSTQWRYGPWRAKQLHLTSDTLKLSAALTPNGLSDWQLSGPLQLSAQPEHEQLVSQPWTLHGQLDAQRSQQQFNGSLSNAAELALKFSIKHNAQGLTAQAQLDEIFLRSGNPLAKSFSAWPATLELDSGRLTANASLRLAPKQERPELTLQLQGKGLSGLYERTQLSGLDAQAQLQTDAKHLQLTLNDLHLAQANPGISLGPVHLKGQYRAPITQPGAGHLTLQQAESGVLGGSLRLPSDTWDLTQPTLHVPVQLQGLQLQELFAQYPAEGLAGHGILDGALVLQLDAAGLSIHDGQLQSRAPGYLQFRSEKIRALGRSNPAMQLVTQSLDDFHFSSLNSRVNYAAQGQLDLAIRLQGQNPAIEQGRPIHFNINLQEDIPTLLASIQLSDKVNSKIQQRVQQRLLQRQSPSAAPTGRSAP